MTQTDSTLPAYEPTPVPPPSRRRTNAISGWVRFPVDSTEYTSTREGGMFVKLVVVDDMDYDQSPWTVCCGVSVSDVLTESFVGDDQADLPTDDTDTSALEGEELLAVMKRQDQAHHDWESRHWPNLHEPQDGTASVEQYLSRNYQASLVLGATGWSGHSNQHGYWRCTFEDLTPEGQALYRQLEALYAGCKLHLLTFLDT